MATVCSCGPNTIRDGASQGGPAVTARGVRSLAAVCVSPISVAHNTGAFGSQHSAGDDESDSQKSSAGGWDQEGQAEGGGQGEAAAPTTTGTVSDEAPAAAALPPGGRSGAPALPPRLLTPKLVMKEVPPRRRGAHEPGCRSTKLDPRLGRSTCVVAHDVEVTRKLLCTIVLQLPPP